MHPTLTCSLQSTVSVMFCPETAVIPNEKECVVLLEMNTSSYSQTPGDKWVSMRIFQRYVIALE